MKIEKKTPSSDVQLSDQEAVAYGLADHGALHGREVRRLDDEANVLQRSAHLSGAFASVYNNDISGFLSGMSGTLSGLDDKINNNMTLTTPTKLERNPLQKYKIPILVVLIAAFSFGYVFYFQKNKS